MLIGVGNICALPAREPAPLPARSACPQAPLCPCPRAPLRPCPLALPASSLRSACALPARTPRAPCAHPACALPVHAAAAVTYAAATAAAAKCAAATAAAARAATAAAARAATAAAARATAAALSPAEALLLSALLLLSATAAASAKCTAAAAAAAAAPCLVSPRRPTRNALPCSIAQPHRAALLLLLLSCCCCYCSAAAAATCAAAAATCATAATAAVTALARALLPTHPTGLHSHSNSRYCCYSHNDHRYCYNSASRGGQQQPLPHPGTLSPQQLREWVIQRGRPGGGGYRAGGAGHQRQPAHPDTLSPQQICEWIVQCGRPGGGGYGFMEAAALGASESAAALGGSASTATGPASDEALHTFTLDSGASRCFFHDCTTVTPLASPVPVSLADPTRGPVVVRASTVLQCPAVPSGSLSGLHLPSFSTNLASNAVLQDTFTHGRQRVAICTSGGYVESGVYAWSTCGVLLVSSTFPPDSKMVPPTQSPPSATSPQHALLSPYLWPSQERYFLLVIDDYTRYTTIFPLRSKANVSGVLIPWIRATRHQLRERFWRDLSVLCLHSNRGGEFSFGIFSEFYRAEGIVQTFTFPTSPQQNGIAERRIGLIMERPRPHSIGQGRLAMRRRFGSGVRSPLSTILPLSLAKGGDTGAAASGGAGPGGAETGGAETGGAKTRGADSGGAACPSSGGAMGAPVGGPRVGQPQLSSQLEMLSPQQIREWIVQRDHLGGGGYGVTPYGAACAGGAGDAAGAGGSGATSPGGAAGARGAGATSLGGTAGAGVAGGVTGGAGGTGATRTGGAGATGAGGAGGAAGVGGAGAGGTKGAGGAAGTRGAGAGGTGGIGAAHGMGTAPRRPFFYP
ncbi:unnamed protein product [Closterium sp. NIES-54]